MGLTLHGRLFLARAHQANQLRVLRGVALFEVAKGLIVLAAAAGIALLIHKEDPWDLADNLLQLLHISPDRHLAQVFLDWADTLTAAKLWAVAATAVAYSFLRFLEAYGLWHAKAWAEWIALISGALYLPFEIYNLAHRLSLFHVLVLMVNLAIVLYMVYLLMSEGAVRRTGSPS